MCSDDPEAAQSHKRQEVMNLKVTIPERAIPHEQREYVMQANAAVGPFFFSRKPTFQRLFWFAIYWLLSAEAWTPTEYFLTLSLPRTPLQSHQKCYVTQYEEPSFS